ncbi:hypothetical protein GTP38_19810 [Duganella sp. FT94W]|uniref:FtsK domain-containing protein n=1 Tax=Duganella lactea TaxID=2692173 RepID=A0ABW9VD49_9BURK|nr:hypothetical protein [Duganella lactea]
MTNSQISAPDALVGAIALEYLLIKLDDQLTDPSFRGAFHVLSGFTPGQLEGFVLAKEQRRGHADKLVLQFPRGGLIGTNIADEYLTDDSSVGVRNRERGDGIAVITAEVENDAEASLADSDRTDASDLRDKNIASIWVDFVAKRVGKSLEQDDSAKVCALLKGLFDWGKCPTAKTGEYLQAVLERFKEEPLSRAAGKALPVIGLPLAEDCFSSLNEQKMRQPSQWAEKFKAHYALECYLDKRGRTLELLDAETLREKLVRLRTPEQQPPIPEPVLEAFHEYIESKNARNPATERLLYTFDWSYVRHCFDKPKQFSSKAFSERTRKALHDEAIVLDNDDELVISALQKMSRKSGGAQAEFREFFEKRNEVIAKDSKLFLEWEDFVHGRRIECTDLLQGIFECLQRFVRAIPPREDAYIQIDGKSQDKNNNFVERNQRACEYFERAYRSLESATKKKIRFDRTLLFKYTSDVFPSVKQKANFTGTKRSGVATRLEFNVSVFLSNPGQSDTKVGTLNLTWKFPVESVLAHERGDFDAMARYFKQKNTALINCYSEYEGVGRKGVPLPLSLEDTEGFADVRSGRGAFIPPQARISSIAAEWRAKLLEISNANILSVGSITNLSGSFDTFEHIYSQGVLALRVDAMDHAHTQGIADAYRNLLLEISNVVHEETRRRLLRIVLSIGQAQVRRSGRRASVAVVCPWHPLRMEATHARQQQLLTLIATLLRKERPAFSDGPHGSLFFKEVEQLLAHPLYPEMALVWDENEASERVVTQAFGNYSIHQMAERSSISGLGPVEDGFTAAAATIEHEVTEYLRLQPHERDNLSVLLYDCDSAALPAAVVNSINRINAKREGGKITCQILLTHRDDVRLREIYRELVSKGVELDDDPTEGTGDFLAKVRVNITAANRIRYKGRTQPVDLAYCRDLISREAKAEWEWVERETIEPANLQPHQWSRRLPLGLGARKIRLQLVCPAQSAAGWAFLYSIAQLCGNGAANAWGVGKCPVLMRTLDFDDRRVDRIFKETHELAAWVVNEDELLDRKLLEQCDVKVIRYVQKSTHGRNLIISSTARDTLLVNTLREKLKTIVSSERDAAWIAALGGRVINDANSISGGLVLKAARRANNTNELLGMVLSRYLVQAELGKGRAIAWCFLDDYSQWLGKKDGASIADLLVLAPTHNPDGSLHLDIVVTEAKFVNFDGSTAAMSASEKQLLDTLSQINDALDETTPTIDQNTWLARLSDLVVLQTITLAGQPSLEGVAWKRAIRNRECTFRVWGYSHIFVYEPQNSTAHLTQVRGIESSKASSEFTAFQEVFGPDAVRELFSHYHAQDHKATQDFRLQNGHPSFERAHIRRLSSERHNTENGAIKESAISLPDDAPSTNVLISVPNIAAQTAAALSSTSGGTSSPVGQNHELLAFLEERSIHFKSSQADGLTWLAEMSARLRHALINRSLTAKLIDGANAVLTPNAGIIKLQGTKDLTVQAVESRVSEIFTSDGIEIISITPESGRVSIAVKRPIREVLHTETVLLDYLKTFDPVKNGEKILVGIAEEDGSPVMLDPSVQPHTLVAGMTGSGKSILIQNILLTIAATRSPAEALIYLIDPKFGLDYRPLEALPHIIKGSGGIIDEPEAAIAALKGLVVEMDSRYKVFKAAEVPNIGAYRRATGKEMPTLWVIHDEFTDWMMIDEYKKVVPEIVSRLSVKARAAGIFLVFAAQRPDKDAMPMQLRSQLGNRLTLKVDNDATSEIAMGIKNGGAARLLGQGHMLVRIGQPESMYVQVPFIDVETVVPLIVKIIQNQYPPLEEESDLPGQ